MRTSPTAERDLGAACLHEIRPFLLSSYPTRERIVIAHRHRIHSALSRTFSIIIVRRWIMQR